jgi:hypothetical protein
MKKICILFLLTGTLSVFGQTVENIRPDTIKHIPKGNVTKLYHSANRYEFETDKDSFNFNKALYVNGLPISASGKVDSSAYSDSSGFADTTLFATTSGDSLYDENTQKWLYNGDTIAKGDSVRLSYVADTFIVGDIQGKLYKSGSSEMTLETETNTDLVITSDRDLNINSEQLTINTTNNPANINVGTNNFNIQNSTNTYVYTGDTAFWNEENLKAKTGYFIDSIYINDAWLNSANFLVDSSWVSINLDTLYFNTTKTYNRIWTHTDGDLRIESLSGSGTDYINLGDGGGDGTLIYSDGSMRVQGSGVDLITNFGTYNFGTDIRNSGGEIELYSGGFTYTFEDDTLAMTNQALKAKYLSSQIINTDTTETNVFILGEGVAKDSASEFGDAQTIIEGIPFDSLQIKGYYIRFNESEGVFEFETGKEDVVWQGPLEDLVLVYNNTGATIPDFTPFYYTGYNGDSIPTIDYSLASDRDNALEVAGITTVEIADNDWGFGCKRGYIRGINTSSLDITKQGFLGDSIVVDSTPPYPSRTIALGYPVKIDASDGVFLVEISNSLEREFISGAEGYVSGPSGTDYLYGFYESNAADANLTQAAASVTFGSANVAYGAHPFSVCGGVGSVTGGGRVALITSGTSITDFGVRTTSDVDTLITDITTTALNEYYEAKKYIGTVTYQLIVAEGAPTAYSLDFNYGYAKYDDSFNRNFYVVGVEATGIAGAAETGLDIELIKHSDSGWTYAATGFTPGNGTLASLSTDYVTEKNLANGQPFAWKNLNLGSFIEGTENEGLIVRITTGTNNSIERMNIKLVIAVDRIAGNE